MRITLNGKSRDVEEGATIQGLLDRERVGATQVAVEINCSIVRRDGFGTHLLHEGDAVEILRFVGGG